MRSLPPLLLLLLVSAAEASEADPSSTTAFGAASLQTELLDDGSLAVAPNLWVDVTRNLESFTAGAHVSLNVLTPFELVDDGSILWAAWRANSRGDGLRVEAHPLSQRRLRLGSIEPLRIPLSIPGSLGTERALAISGRWRQLRAHAWTQAGHVINPINNEKELRSAVSAGIGWEQGGLSATLSVLHVDFGKLRPLAEQGFDEPGSTRGLHANVSYTAGERIPPPVDFEWEGANADRWVVFFPEDEPVEGRAWSFAIESAWLEQRLIERGVPDSTTSQMWTAGATGLFRLGPVRFHVRATKKPVEFIQLGVPSTPPYFALQENAAPRDEVSLRAGAEYVFGRSLPRVGLLVTTTRPASLRLEGLERGGVTSRRWLLRGRNLLTVLPGDDEPHTIFEGKATLSWQPASLIGIAAELSFRRDPNRAEYRDDIFGTGGPVYIEPDTVGVRLLTQLRF